MLKAMLRQCQRSFFGHPGGDEGNAKGNAEAMPKTNFGTSWGRIQPRNLGREARGTQGGGFLEEPGRGHTPAMATGSSC